MTVRALHNWTIVLTSAMLLCTSGCEDLLPVYQPPKNYFTARASVDTFTVQYYETEEWFADLHGPLIDYDRYNSNRRFLFRDSIINTYEETIETPAEFNGLLEIWQNSIPTNKATYKFTQSDLSANDAYNPFTKAIKVDPGKALVVKRAWNFKMDDGRWIHKTNLLKVMRIEPEHPPGTKYGFYAIYYEPELFKARISVTLNKSMPVIISDTSFYLTVIGKLKLAPP